MRLPYRKRGTPAVEHALAHIRKEVVQTHTPGECWLWDYSTDSSGYGTIRPSAGEKHYSLHVLVYRHLVGDVPEGTELDHLCRQTRCCNPAHLEPVHHGINVLRSRQGLCRAGLHDLTDGTNVGHGGVCKPCRNAKARARRRAGV